MHNAISSTCLLQHAQTRMCTDLYILPRNATIAQPSLLPQTICRLHEQQQQQQQQQYEQQYEPQYEDDEEVGEDQMEDHGDAADDGLEEAEAAGLGTGAYSSKEREEAERRARCGGSEAVPCQAEG